MERSRDVFREQENIIEFSPIISSLFISEEIPKESENDLIIFKKNKISLEIKNEIKEKINFSDEFLLSNIETLVLESERASSRADRFIRRVSEDWLEQRLEMPSPRYDYSLSQGVFSSPTGLRVSVSRDGYGGYTIDRQRIEGFVDGYTRIDFTPGGRTSFDQSAMTESLAMGVAGVIELIDAVDSGEITIPEVLVGHTNINMALIAQRLGFRIVDQSRDADGKINRNLTGFTVVGKLKDVRAKVREFEETGRIERLAQRAKRPTRRASAQT